MNKKIIIAAIIGFILICSSFYFLFPSLFLSKDTKHSMYVQELNFKAEKGNSTFIEDPTMNLTITPEVATSYYTSNGLSKASHNILLCMKLPVLSPPSSLGLRFNNPVQDISLTEVKYENITIGTYYTYKQNTFGNYPNGSAIITTTPVLNNFTGFRNVYYELPVLQTTLTNQFVYYFDGIEISPLECKKYLFQYTPLEGDTTFKWDAYFWEGNILSPSYSMVLDPNWVLENSEFQIQEFVDGMADDGQNLSLSDDNGNFSGYAESVRFCPNNFKINWSFVDWNVPFEDYGISQVNDSEGSAIGMRYLLYLNETGTLGLRENITNIGWSPAGATQPTHITNCVIDNCIQQDGTSERWERDTIDDNILEMADISIEAWVKGASGANCGGENECTIYTYSDVPSQDFIRFETDENTGVLSLDFAIGGVGFDILTAQNIRDGQWHYVYVSLGSTRVIYVDGIEVTSNAPAYGILPSIAYAHNKIGNGKGADSSWDGEIDEFVLRSNKTGGTGYLTPSQIQNNFREGVARYDIGVRFGTNNATIETIEYENVTNGQINLNESIECMQYRYYGYRNNLSVADPYLISLNFSYTSQAQNLEIDLIHPIDGSNFDFDSNISFYAEYSTSLELNLTNSTLYVWFDNSTIFGTNETNITNRVNTTNLSLSHFGYGSYLWNYFACSENATFQLCSFDENNFSLSIAPTINNVTFNSSTYETAFETFIINITSTIEPTNADLFWNGTEIEASVEQIGEEYMITATHDIPTSPIADIEFFFEYDIGSLTNSRSDNHTQNVNHTRFDLCNETFNVAYINFTFKDEVTDNPINASLNSEFSYYLGSGVVTKDFTHSDSDTNTNYTFCFEPEDRPLSVNVTEFLYKNTPDYQQRSFIDNLVLTNITTQQVLYLLSTTDGIFTTFQVLNAANQPIEDVFITVESNIGGTLTLVDEKFTDAAGAATFFVNPDTEYIFTFTHPNFQTFIFVVFPTQSSYTITLGEVTPISFPPSEGITYLVYPTQTTLSNGTNYRFGLDIDSSIFNLDSYGFFLVNESGFGLGSASGAVITGSNISTLVHTGNQTRIIMNYFWEINGTFANASKTWFLMSYYQGEFSVATFFDDLRRFSGAGFDDFTRAIIGYFILLMLVGFASATRLTESPLAIGGLVTASVFLLDWAGFFQPIGILSARVIVGILFVSFIIFEYQR